MIHDISTRPRRARAPSEHGATVTDLASRRRGDDVLGSVTVVFGGVNYGTIPLRAPYAAGKPFALYVVPAGGAATGEDGELRGPVDCLITDDAELALDEAR
jgi:hypothetical protein